MLENNPCFEIWLLLHFIHTSGLFINCQQVATELKKPDRIPAYDKSEKVLRAACLYSALKTQLQKKAIPTARLLERDRAQHRDRHPRAQTYLFFEWYFQNQ